MLGVGSNVITHKLNVDLTYHPIKQKKKKFALNRCKAINEDVAELLKVNFICKVNYPDWLTNIILVKKANEK